MKYFIVEVDKNYVAPMPIGWNGIIDRKTLCGKKTSQVQKHMLFQVKAHMQMVFTDVLTFPCFMVSSKVRDIIKKYDSFVRFVRVILYDKERKNSMAYYIPFMEQGDCKEVQDETNKNVWHIRVRKEDLKEKIFITVKNNENYYAIMRMDLVESILRRETIGIGLREIDII